MYWIFYLVELRALGLMDCTFSESAEIEPIEELVLDSDVETLECESSGLQLETDAGTFEHEASGSQLGRSC